MTKNDDVTCTKAIGIILMVLGHCCSSDIVSKIIYSFHMPLFFIMSGYCFKIQYLNSPFLFFKKRICGLWWPYIKWCSLFIIFHNLLFVNLTREPNTFLESQPYTNDQIITKLQNLIIHMCGEDYLLGGFWFLKALFIGSMMSYAAYWIMAKVKLINGNFRVYILLSLFLLFMIIGIFLNILYRPLTVLYICPQHFFAAALFTFGFFLKEIHMPKFNYWQIPIFFHA